jgi:hypothetical protein
VTRAAPTALRKMRWRQSSNPHKRPPASGEGKENPCVQMGATECPDTWSHRAPMASCRADSDHASIDRGTRRAALEWSRVGKCKMAPAVLAITHGGSSALPGQPRQRINRDHGGGNALSGIGRGTENTMRVQAVAV